MLPLVAKGRVSDIMPQGNGLDQILVQPEETANSPADARYHLHVQHPVRYMIVIDQGKDLGRVNIPGKSPGMKDTIEVNNFSGLKDGIGIFKKLLRELKNSLFY